MPEQLAQSSHRLLQQSVATLRPCRCPGCICLTWSERRNLRRVGRIVRALKRHVRRQARQEALGRAKARETAPQG